nr:hypothetical protein C4D60_Mb05t27880 [Ipomoea batatas]GME15558.1 hypothetical protein C4D60_Mb05t27880 [Ipomoea batatas]
MTTVKRTNRVASAFNNLIEHCCLIAATRGEYCGYAVSSGGRFPSDTPDPVPVAFKLLNLLQLESFVQEIHHEDRGAELL